MELQWNVDLHDPSASSLSSWKESEKTFSRNSHQIACYAGEHDPVTDDTLCDKVLKEICTILRDISYSPSSGRSGSSFIFSTSIQASFKILGMTSPGSDLYLKKLEKNVWIGEIFVIKLSKFHLHEPFTYLERLWLPSRTFLVRGFRRAILLHEREESVMSERTSARKAKVHCRSRVVPTFRERVKSPPTIEEGDTRNSLLLARGTFCPRSHILLVCVLEKTLKIEKLTS